MRNEVKSKIAGEIASTATKKPEYLKQQLALHKNQAVASCDQSDQQEVRQWAKKRTGRKVTTKSIETHNSSFVRSDISA